MFVDRDGKMKPSSLQASQIVFERKSEQMGRCELYYTVTVV